MKSTTTIAATCAACAFAVNAGATVLTFGPATFDPATYGDRVGNFGSLYGSEGGTTPNIVADYVPQAPFTPFTVYASGYSGLSYALGHALFNVPGHVQLTPDAGYDVILTSFQIGGWSSTSYTNSRIQVVDTAGNTYYDSTTFTFVSPSVFTYTGTPIRASVGLRIVVNDFGDLGLDNVQFSQIANVPEPRSYALMLAGLGLAGWVARRQSNRA